MILHIWDSGYQRCYRSYSSKSLAWGSIQFSVVLIGYVQFVAAFVLLLSLVDVCRVAVFVELSMDPMLVDIFERIFLFAT